jgi:hypothetical protein
VCISNIRRTETANKAWCVARRSRIYNVLQDKRSAMRCGCEWMDHCLAFVNLIPRLPPEIVNAGHWPSSDTSASLGAKTLWGLPSRLHSHPRNINTSVFSDLKLSRDIHRYVQWHCFQIYRLQIRVSSRENLRSALIRTRCGSDA